MPRFQVVLTDAEWDEIQFQLARIPSLERDSERFHSLLDSSVGPSASAGWVQAILDGHITINERVA